MRWEVWPTMQVHTCTITTTIPTTTSATNNSRKTRLAGRSVYLILHGTCSLARDRRAFGQAKLVAHSLGANDGRTHIFDHIHGAFNKLCVGREHTA